MTFLTFFLFRPGQHQRGRGGTLPGREHPGERQRAAIRGEQRRADQTGPGGCGCRDQVGLLLTLDPFKPAIGLPLAGSDPSNQPPHPPRGAQPYSAASLRNMNDLAYEARECCRLCTDAHSACTSECFHCSLDHSTFLLLSFSHCLFP